MKDLVEVVVVPLDVLEALLDEKLRQATDQLRPTTSNEEHTKKWWTNAYAQEQLGVSPPTLARWRRHGLLPYAKIGGKVFYRRTDIERLLERRLRTGTSEGSDRHSVLDAES